MKKLLLGLGTSLLAIVPLAAVISCSSSVTPTLETEAAKFETSKTKTPNTTSGDAAKSINNASDATTKLNALKVFADVPTLSSGFTFEVKSAAVSSTNTSVDVKITVTETATSKTKDLIFVVTGLVATEPTLETEAAKFSTVVTKAPSTTSMTAATSLNDASDAAAKLAALKVLAEVPTLSSGFTFVVMGGAIDKTANTTLNVDIIITQGESTDTNTNTKMVTFVVTGLTVPSEEEISALTAQITSEANGNLVTKATIKTPNETAEEAKATITNDETLKTYYAEVTLVKGLVYEFVSSVVDTTTNTTLNVTVKVYNELYGSTSVNHVIAITDFIAPTGGSL